MPPIDKLLSQYSNPVRSWPGEEDLDAEARANYEAANPPKLQTEGGSIDKGDLLPIVRYPEAKKSPSEWQSSSDVMRQLDDGWRIEPFSRLTAPFKSMAEAWRTQPVLGPMVRPSQMHPEAFNQMSSDAMTVAGTGMTGGIGRAAVGHALPAGTAELGIFGGRKAKTADLDALARAEEMARVGTPREEIWSQTGWFSGPDGKWRFEIDDSGATFRGKDRLRHPDMYDAYDDLRDSVVLRSGRQNEGAYMPGFGPMPDRIVIGPDSADPRSIALHEYQHAIQKREGFAKGESPSGLLKEASRIPNTPEARALWGDDKVDQAKALMAPGGPDLAMDLYKRHAGETEARAVQARQDLTPEQRRARAPWLDYDVPEKDQIVRFGNESGASSASASVVPFDRLPAEVKQDIAGWVTDNIPAVRNDVRGMPEYAAQHLEGLVQGQPLGVRTFDMPIAQIKGFDRVPSDAAVSRYQGMLAESEAPPILMDGDRFVDGGHRLEAYRRAGRTTIPAVDIGPILRMNWDNWLAGVADDPSFPVVSRVSSSPWAMSNKPLDMSPEARLARAREMGFDTGVTYYKGHYPYVSGGPITNAKGQIVGDDGPYVLKDQLAGFFSANPDVANRFAGVGLFDHNAVAPVYLRYSNPLEIDARGKHAASVQFDSIARRDGMMDEYDAFRTAFDRGHDAVIIRNTKDEGDIIRIATPEQVRSVNADFDPSLSSSPTLMASIDPLTAAVNPARQVDPLGYYSPTLDAALRLSQKKGTPEQMLAQLKKAGAKDSEIEVSGLKKMFEGKKSVSQEEIVKALEEGKIGLEEKVYGSPDANAADAAARATEQALREAFEAAGASPMEARMLLADASMGDVPPQYMTREIIPLVEAFQRVADETESRDLAGGPRWSAHSLDPENPTYREVVLHLPETKKQFASWKVTDPNTGRSATYTSEENARKYANPGDVIERQPDMTLNAGFRSGHFDEPNIVGHMMVSETRLPLDASFPAGVLDEIGQRIMKAVGASNVKDLGSGAMDTAVKRGAVTPDEASAWSFHHFGNRLGRDPRPRVLTLDQVQSDWGQKLRDGGVRDEGKVQGLRQKIAEADAQWKALGEDARAFIGQSEMGPALEKAIEGSSNPTPSIHTYLSYFDSTAPDGSPRYAPEVTQRASEMYSAIADAISRRKLYEAELRTAEAASPGHPLVNTTDQWLNTTLRRAIRMASEEGQDYIAIPSGNTVLGYNPGQEKGMLGFYGGMPEEMSGVMASLKQAATKAPNEPVINVLDPKTIDALAQAGILDKKKIEGISAARVLKNAEARFQGIVPKNLYALLQKLDKNTPPPQVIDTLDSPSGKTGLGEGFTLFKITPEAKKAAKESGQPLFRFGGRVN